MLEDVHLAHRAGAVLEQPRIDAGLVEFMPGKGRTVEGDGFWNTLRDTHLQGRTRITSVTLYGSMQMAQQSLSISCWGDTIPLLYIVL